MSKIYIVVEGEPLGEGRYVEMTLNYNSTAPSDAEAVQLAEVILTSDLIQNNPQLGSTPVLSVVTVETPRTLYPPTP